MALTVVTIGYIESPEFTQIKERLANLADNAGGFLLREAVETVVDSAIELVKIEPPLKTPGPGRPFYVRGLGPVGRTTGRPIGGRATSEDLSGSWQSTVRSSPDRVTAVIVNTASYASVVVGRRTQAMQHRGRWSTIEDIVDFLIGEVGAVVPEVNISQASGFPEGSPLIVQLEQSLIDL